MAKPAAIYLYPNAAFPTTEDPGPPVFGRDTFNTGAGGDISDLLYSRLSNLPQTLPQAAEIFVAFMTPFRPPYHAYTDADHAAISALGPVRTDYMPNENRLCLITMCRQLRNSSFMRSLLTHSRGAARRHFLITPYELGACVHEPEFRAEGAPEVPPWVRRCALAMSFDNLVHEQAIRDFPRRVQMPYESSVRWDPSWEQGSTPGTPPWRLMGTERRQLLVSFTGSLRGLPRSMDMRKALVLQCGRVPNSVCMSFVAEGFPLAAHSQREAETHETATLRRALRLKRRSIFCLEPTGFSPPRKSIVDSLLSGCIPVLFYEEAQYKALMPFFFGGWGANASVRVAPDVLLKGKVDVIALLASLPPERVSAMQRTIATHAHQLVYGLGPRGLPGDAIDTLFSIMQTAVSITPP